MVRSTQGPISKELNSEAELANANDRTHLRLFNREVSWLEFDRRVLDEAMDLRVPVLERLKFLSIFSSNLDEFFMIRVSGLKEQIEEGVIGFSPEGLTPAEQLIAIRKRLRPMIRAQSKCLHDHILPELERSGIRILHHAGLSAKERKKLSKYFTDNIFPILTPQSVDSSHPFPYISNLSLNIGLFIEPLRAITKKGLTHLFRQKRFARIKLPASVPRLIQLSDRKNAFVLLEEVITANAYHLFPNMRVSGGFLFRVSRDADIEIREDEAGDLLRTLERELQRRRFRFPVRLEVAASMPDKMVKLLRDGIGLNDLDVYRISGFVNIPDLMHIYSMDRPRLKDKPLVPVHPAVLLEKKNIFEVLKRGDVLLHHPYTAYSTVTDFLAQAADDPRVQAIKICLYRTGKDSPVVRSLIRASQAGKQVTAVVELKARFDEVNNIEWARRLENEGVHVVYGINSLKTHSKVLLVVRREGERLVRYVHIATGNYNPVTARQYTDLGLLTADQEIGNDATSLFNFLTGYSQQIEYSRLLVAPVNMRDALIELVRQESKAGRKRKNAHIILKLNSLTDVGMIEELYRASSFGVKIELIVRGICSLRPHVRGLSDNITVRSIVGRFLEHSRIYYFANGDGPGMEKIFISSADWMHRNIDRRVEVAVPVLDREIAGYLKNTVLAAYLDDNVNASTLRSDGTYRRVDAGSGEKMDSQMAFAGADTLRDIQSR